MGPEKDASLDVEARLIDLDNMIFFCRKVTAGNERGQTNTDLIFIPYEHKSQLNGPTDGQKTRMGTLDSTLGRTPLEVA